MLLHLCLHFLSMTSEEKKTHLVFFVCAKNALKETTKKSFQVYIVGSIGSLFLDIFGLVG